MSTTSGGDPPRTLLTLSVNAELLEGARAARQRLARAVARGHPREGVQNDDVLITMCIIEATAAWNAQATRIEALGSPEA